MKKKILVFTALLLGFMTVFNSCKKYEDGPLLSLKSKNGRITGEWELKEYKYTRTTDEGTTTRTFNGSIMTFSGKEWSNYTYDYIDTSYTYSYSMNLTIEKGGTYKWYEVEKGDIDEWTAYWSWLDGQSGKEQLLLEDDGIYLIKKLTNKELIIEYSYTWSETSDGDNDFSNSETIYTFEKK
jgi:hypothetical protein